MLLNLKSCYFILSYLHIWQPERNFFRVKLVLYVFCFYSLIFFINKFQATTWKRNLLHVTLFYFYSLQFRSCLESMNYRDLCLCCTHNFRTIARTISCFMFDEKNIKNLERGSERNF
jgi:hypothetical protein